MRYLLATLVLTAALAACNQPTEAPPQTAATAQPGAAPAQAKAKVGAPAPDFALPDLDGNTVKLSSFAGKTVVLEWFNPDCPFVQLSHRKGGLKDNHARHIQNGVVWLAINSAAPGKQGHDRNRNVQGRADFAMSYPVLLDESGAVGRLYGATRTPHMYIVDAKGTLVYAGAIDSTEGGEPEPDEPVTNHVDVALAALAAGKPIEKPETEAFGCSVKY